jgi:hypothetical protein
MFIVTILFSGIYFTEYIRECEKSAVNEAGKLGTKDFAAKSINELAGEIVARYTPQPLIIKPDETKGILEQIDLSVSQDSSQYRTHNRKRPICVKGLRLTVRLPFFGMPNLLGLKPASAHYSNQFPTGEIESDNIVIAFDNDHSDTEVLQRWVNEDIALIKKFADSLNEEIKQVELSSPVTLALQARKDELQQIIASLDKFNFPVEFKA